MEYMKKQYLFRIFSLLQKIYGYQYIENAEHFGVFGIHQGNCNSRLMRLDG